MSPTYGTRAPNKRFVKGGSESIPTGAHVIPVKVKEEYDTVPFHVYHPTPHEAITILQNKKNKHEWLVCGWYIDTYRQGGVVAGLLYKQVVSEPDREFVLAELKKHDKDGTARFAL